MKLFTDWGFTRQGWRQGQRGEYWVVAQAVLFIAMFFVPVYQPVPISLEPVARYVLWAIALALGLFALILLLKGLLDLGKSLTPLPYPREDGQLVQTGVYGIVRHPLYSGLILGVLSWAVFNLSLSHAIASLVFFVFFNAKANQEEQWLSEKYPDYAAYQQRVKKLIPWVY
ncbi:isoprenylcysteine carboxylmethyltransferase family protein [Oscillatoria sp. FACHB-1407]|uniref:methyltransferase family protein n=1 Tax=Oscillatoria sp. FACHB-1407 TaxID=2692847 RepID=UPI0016837876|nr:isoprenylcysteine carboxylmethyltransferase family protein [Oscillatoria sp. FACHB-1407]MBD2462214.1 isoprenylcysteine carboxylmethyltransferase family protein [Oscillatoria sp. FACHB-1407]